MTTRLLLHPLSAAEAASVEAGEPPAGTLWAPGYPGDGDRGVARRFLETCADAGSPSRSAPTRSAAVRTDT